ncbi:MAG: sigma 54-interacting transcriptional regulator [Desulforhopalus sp.]
MTDNEFFRKLVLNISSSIELPKAMGMTYKFLAQQMPIDGISLHRYDSRLRSLHLLFLVTKDNFYDLDILVPFSDEDADFLNQTQNSKFFQNIANYQDSPVALKHSRAIEEYLPSKNRSYMVTMLIGGEEIVGHLCLIGRAPNCFSQKHEKWVKLMKAPLSLAMMNMLQHRQTKELMQRLDEQRLQLTGEVNLFKKSALIGTRGGLHGTMETVAQLAGKETPVLIMGETGTGKELIADAVQRISARAGKPYIKVNCGAIPDTLMDSELFGYEKGAFTGAQTNKMGRFEQADGGTLFLDEVGELPPPAQVRLLRVLQNSIVERVGGNKSIPINVRIIAATNRSLETMLQDGSFREDLFYRLNVFPITIPPLRNRVEDIPLLVHHFIKEASKRLKLSGEIQLDGASIMSLQSYSWPGNVRELENLVERALTLNSQGPLNLAQYLPKDPGWYIGDKESESYMKKLVREQVQEVLQNIGQIPENRASTYGTPESTDVYVSLDEMMSDYIKKVLDHCRGKINGPGGAAEILKVNPSTLRKRMDKLKIPFGYRK